MEAKVKSLYHEDVWRSGGVAPHIIDLGVTDWSLGRRKEYFHLVKYNIFVCIVII
jgi:hypothetical protein